jgi:hypothetical protein
MSTAVEPQTEQAEQPATLVRVDPEHSPIGSVFANETNFAAAQRMAKALAVSTIVPSAYSGSIANCMIALEMAHRTGTGVMAVMQNLHVIDGKPGWSSSFLIAAVNTCGRYTKMRFEFRGTEGQDDWGCRAHATELATGDRLDGEWITWRMAKGEGWLTRKASKWATMPGQMMRYRAAAFWTRVHEPELALGMHTAEELSDFDDRTSVSAKTAELNAALAEADEMIADVESIE